jgi:hypothetical protein
VDERDTVTRRQFLVTGSAGALALATSRETAAQAPAQKLHVKPVPGEVFIDHGINQETRLETLRGYLTPASQFFVRQHSNVPAIDLRRGGCESRAKPSNARSSSRSTTCCGCPRGP